MTRCDPKIIEALKSIESSGRKEGAVIDSTLEKYKEKKAVIRPKMTDYPPLVVEANLG